MGLTMGLVPRRMQLGRQMLPVESEHRGGVQCKLWFLLRTWEFEWHPSGIPLQPPCGLLGNPVLHPFLVRNALPPQDVVSACVAAVSIG